MRKAASALLLVVLLSGFPAWPVWGGEIGELSGPATYIARLPAGSVELIAVTNDYRPTYNSRWWRPDGTQASIGKYKALQTYDRKQYPGEKTRAFLVRIDGLPADASPDPVGGVDAASTMGGAVGRRHYVGGEGPADNPSEGSTDNSSWAKAEYWWEPTSVYDLVDYSGMLTTKRRESFYKVFSAPFVDYRPTTKLRIGVSEGPWQSVLVYTPLRVGTATFTSQGHEWTVAFEPTRGRSLTRIRYSLSSDKYRKNAYIPIHTYGQEQRRLVAATRYGPRPFVLGEVTGSDLDASGCTVSFELRPDAISAVHLQVRPYYHVQFDNIALDPGVKTEVAVTSCDASFGEHEQLPTSAIGQRRPQP